VVFDWREIMAKDDYQVIVYQILAYLYNCLKKDIKVDEEYLRPQGKLFNINTTYWNFVIINLLEDGFIDGVRTEKVWGEKYPIIGSLEEIGITPRGIEYLTDNAFIKRAVEMLKDAKAIIPFV